MFTKVCEFVEFVFARIDKIQGKKSIVKIYSI